MAKGTATEDRSVWWRTVSVLAVIVVFAILFAVYSDTRPDDPSAADARAESSAVMDDVDSGDLAGLEARFLSPYPPGPDELYRDCRDVPFSQRTIQVLEGREFQPPSFRVEVSGREPDGSVRACGFRLVRVDRNWDLRYP